MKNDYREIKGELYSLDGIIVYLYEKENDTIVVKDLDGKKIFLDASTYEEQLQQVPLTRDILVKNFFAVPSDEPKGVPANSNDKYKIEKDGKTLYFEVRDREICWFEPNSKSYYGYRLTPVKYIDELQKILSWR